MLGEAGEHGRVHDRLIGKVSPGGATWSSEPLDTRIDWWIDRIGTFIGLAAGSFRGGGSLTGKVPLQDLVGASGAALGVCAVAREFGIVNQEEWIPLVSWVVLHRELASVDRGDRSPTESVAPSLSSSDGDAAMATLSDSSDSRRTAMTAKLKSLIDALRQIETLLADRPRGGLAARSFGKLPVVGVVGGYLDEKKAVKKAGDDTRHLLSDKQL